MTDSHKPEWAQVQAVIWLSTPRTWTGAHMATTYTYSAADARLRPRIARGLHVELMLLLRRLTMIQAGASQRTASHAQAVTAAYQQVSVGQRMWSRLHNQRRTDPHACLYCMPAPAGVGAAAAVPHTMAGSHSQYSSARDSSGLGGCCLGLTAPEQAELVLLSMDS